MLRFARKASEKIGLPPGSLVYVGKQDQQTPIRLSLIQYSQEQFKVQNDCSLEEILNPSEKFTNNWANIDGLHNIELLQKIGEKFQIHPLLMEDILNTEQRPKLEIGSDYIFIQLRMYRLDEKKKIIEEQVSLLYNDSFLLSFQEMPGDVFDVIRKRIIEKTGQVRHMRTDYLAYVLTDALIDHYYVVMESISDELEALEEQLFVNPEPDTMQVLQQHKRKLIKIKKSIWPVRELLSGLDKTDHPLIKKVTKPYLRDLYEHTVQILETVESFRDIISGLQDLYLSSLSTKMNEVMKTLTIIATIFIPLTFLAGVFGMNFKHMPELGWVGSYPIFWGIIITVGISMYKYFKKKNWL